MSPKFDDIHNHYESAVFAAVLEIARDFPALREGQLLGDVACIALNRLPPRYLRHEADFSIYLSDREREENASAVREAVLSAVECISKRLLA